MNFDYVGFVTVPYPTDDEHVATKYYVDGWGGYIIYNNVAPPANHATRHGTGGADPITPAAIGALPANDSRLTVKPYPPVTLVDQGPVTTNAALGTHFRVTISADRTLAPPTNPTDGQVCVWEVSPTGGGARLLTLSTAAGGFKLGSTITAISTTALNTSDFIQAIYSQSRNLWLVIAYAKGL